MMGDAVESGTLTSGSTTTMVDTGKFVWESDNEIEGTWFSVLAGTGIGEVKNVKTSTTSSFTLVPRSAFTATLDNTTQYVITRRWTPQQYVDSIAAAVRRVQSKVLMPLDDLTGNLHEQITMGDILSTDGHANGQFEDTSGTFPTGWTIDGNTTMAVETANNNVRAGRSSAKMTSNGSALAQLRQTIKYFERYAGTQVTLKVDVEPDTATRALIRVGDGGVSTSITDTSALAVTVWEKLSAVLTLHADPKALIIDLEITAGGAVNAYWDRARLIWDGGIIYEYDLPTRLVYLSKVYRQVGSTTAGTQEENGWREIPRDFWHVQRGANPKLVFNPDLYQPERDIPLRLKGQAHPSVITSGTLSTAYAETVEVPPEYVKAYAKWYLLNSLPFDVMGQDLRRERDIAQRAYFEMEDAFDVPAEPGAELVQVA
jgi:hypothetical protein